MWSEWIKEITDEAAQEDADRFIEVMGSVFKEIFKSLLLIPSLEEKRPKEILDDIFKILLHYYNNNLSNKKSELDEFCDALKAIYSYARGEAKSNNMDSAKDMIERWSYVLRKLLASFKIYDSKPKFDRLKHIEISVESEKVFSKAISVRFTEALKMFRIRNHIERAYFLKMVGDKKALIELSKEGQGVDFFNEKGEITVEGVKALELAYSISSSDLAYLASVHYTYIIKLIRTNKMPACKDNDSKFWQIPILGAVYWLRTRPNSPKWIYNL